MRMCRLFLCCMGGILLFSCNSRPSVSSTDISMEASQDTTVAASDSTDNEEEECAVPTAADEYFNDFIYSFTTNKSYQLSRIVFPLLKKSSSKTTYIQRKQWNFSRLHLANSVYTVFFDKASSLELEKKNDLRRVVVEHIDMKKEYVRSHVFEKNDAHWMLTKINDQSLATYYDREFMEFYQAFVTDSAFQIQHVSSSITIRMADPDDEFSTIDGSINVEQWPTFCPELPHDVFTNIDYGQSSLLGNHRVLSLEGYSNGFQCLLYFVREDGEWFLTRMEN